ncbi:hypothetical protein MTO96_034142 [Rhipicephalus appendiculatus]
MKFLKCSILSAKGIVGLLKIDIDNAENHIPLEKVDIGYKFEQIIKNSQVSSKDVFQFRMECKQFLISATKKVLERSPLKFAFVRGLSSLDPRQMCSKPDECLTSFRKVLDALIAVGRIAEHFRDTVFAEYTELLHEQKHQLRQFDKSVDRLDEFYPDLLKFSSSYSELWSIVKLLLVLSHGQATVERGFSVNSQGFDLACFQSSGILVSTSASATHSSTLSCAFGPSAFMRLVGKSSHPGAVPSSTPLAVGAILGSAAVCSSATGRVYVSASADTFSRSARCYNDWIHSFHQRDTFCTFHLLPIRCSL